MKKTFLLFFLCSIVYSVWASNGDMHGNAKVTDENGGVYTAYLNFRRCLSDKYSNSVEVTYYYYDGDDTYESSVREGGDRNDLASRSKCTLGIPLTISAGSETYTRD